jgi:hypothetical protein
MRSVYRSKFVVSLGEILCKLGCPERVPARCYQWRLIDRSSDAGVTETYDMRVIFRGTETPCVDGGRKSPEPLIM